MRPQKQANRHRPDEGLYGDCHRTCLAMLLDMDKFDIPNFGELHPDDSEAFNIAVEEWLMVRGFRTISIPFQAPPEDVLNFMRVVNPGRYYILGGKSRTGVNHSVIGLNDRIIADPSLTDAGIVGPCEPDGHTWVTFLTQERFTSAGDMPQADSEYVGVKEPSNEHS